MRLNIIFIIFLFCPKEYDGLVPINLALNFIKPTINFFVNAALSSNNTECIQDLRLLSKSTFDLELWALKMLDANNKFVAPGMFHGNVRFLGSFDECMSVRKKMTHQKTITGQYCTANVEFSEADLNFVFKIAILLFRSQKLKTSPSPEIFRKYAKVSFDFCVPNSCSAEDLNQIYTNVAKMLKLPLKIQFSENTCFYEGKKFEFSGIDVCAFCFFGLVCAVLLASTIYDIFLRIFGENENILISGSVFTNMKKLLSTHCEHSSLTCMYGIKVITMGWIIFGHVALYKNLNYNSNIVETLHFLTRIESVIFLAVPYGMETLFSIGGILCIYVYFVYDKRMKTNIFLFYLHRLLRLVPGLLATILFTITFMKHLVEGPLAPFVLETTTDMCKKTWWYSLFFISNFNDGNDQCVTQSWYLSIDTQLYLLYPLIIYCIKKNPKRTFQGLFTICLISIIYTFYKVIMNNLGFVIHVEVPPSEYPFVYSSTICRMPPVLIGLFFGYLIHKHSSEKIQIGKILNIFLWLTSLCVMLVLVAYQRVFMTEEFDVWRSAFFNSVSRSLWSLAVCFIIFSCSTGHGGWVNTFLSHPVFIVLGKLTYSLYLTHVVIIYVVVGNMKKLDHFDYFQSFSDFCGIYVLSVSISTIVWLMFEAPIFSYVKHLEKLALKDEKKTE